LISSLWRTLCAPPLLAVVRYGEVQATQACHRRDCASSVQTAIVDLLK
jgi:1-acyl-sn-glycerol-3-phosphate acyltransferase